MASMVIISKKFHNPEITYTVVHDGLSLELKLDDYLTALISEIGSPLWMLTPNSLEKKLLAASSKIVQDMKDQTVYSPPLVQ